MKRRIHFSGLLLFLSLPIFGIANDEITSPPPRADWVWSLPPGFPVPRVPPDNPMSEAKFQLGRRLFYDQRLSANGHQSCASCHRQDKAFSDGRKVGIGSTGEHHPRNPQGLGNVAYAPTLTWANPAMVSLEKQMEAPLFGTGPIEMGIDDHNKAAVLARIEKDARYPQSFRQSFPDDPDPINFSNIIKAIATFERALISGNTKYDKSNRGELRLTAAEARGKALFFGEKAECFHCHGSFNFNDQIIHQGTKDVETPFHNTGLYNLGNTGAFPYPNRGVHEITGKVEDMGAFRAPSLRNIAMTAPYMHDGSINSLKAVIDFYAAGGRLIKHGPLAGDGRKNPYKSELISTIKLSPQEKSDLLQFLMTLTDRGFVHDKRFSKPSP